jgi:hypothetical protein
VGKSTLLESMALDDIRAGHGVAFIDPHGQSAENIADCIPVERTQDVLYVEYDPEHPIGFNVLDADPSPLTVEHIVSAFRNIWRTSWGANLEGVLRCSLYRGCCPIHKGTSPREFVITMSKGLWYCFGNCGGGDHIQFVAKLKGIKRNEAANEIASYFGTVHGCPAGTAHKTTAPITAPPAPANDRQGFDPEAYAARLDASHTLLAPLGISEATFWHFKSGFAATGVNRGRLASRARHARQDPGILRPGIGRQRADAHLPKELESAPSCVQLAPGVRHRLRAPGPRPGRCAASA